METLILFTVPIIIILVIVLINVYLYTEIVEKVANNEKWQRKTSMGIKYWMPKKKL